MFSKATVNFVRLVDPDGSFIHVSRVNDSDKLLPMALVVKRNRIWFWQRPKYQPTDFTLGDLLQGDEALTPGVSESDFLSYQGTFRDNLSAKIDGEGSLASITAEGRGAFKLQSCFGKLKKEELDVKKLLHDSRNRQVDMQHVLVQQLKKGSEVLVVVKERILTTNSCSVTQTRKEYCALQGVLSLIGLLGSSVKVCVKESNSIEVDSDVSLEIPSGTVIAYSVLELVIKKDGQYAICLQPSTFGGIESDSWPSHDSLDVVDGRRCDERVFLGALLKGRPESDLSPLALLHLSARRALFQELRETLRDRAALSYLQRVLQDLCCGDTPVLADRDELSDSQRELVSAILHRLGVEAESCHCGGSPVLNAAHMLVSALEELPDETLSFLSESSPDFLEAFDTLMCLLKESGESLPIERLPAPLQDNQTFQQGEQLFGCTDVTMRRDAERLWVETGSELGLPVVVLFIGVHGLSLLYKVLKE